MKKTVLITGSSAGIGKATAIHFAERNFNVIATMRNPDKGNDLAALPNIHVHQMDVTDSSSVRAAIASGIKVFGSIDVLVNNAGIGVLGAFEATEDKLILAQFDTNVYGVMHTIKAILPHFRSKRDGTIINISSGVGIIPIPMQSLYDATKFTIEGFSESLSYELATLGISVKIVLPGAVKSDFFKSLITADISAYPDYTAYQNKVLENVRRSNETTGADPAMVASIIFRAATDGKKRLRYMAGKDISLFSKIRRVIPESLFMRLVKKNFEG